MIHKINYIITRIFDVILYPFGFINEFWGILFLSLLMSFVVLYIYKFVSSPGAIKDTKNKIKANILAIRIYKDFWKIILSSFFKSLYYVLKYFTLNFGPVLLIIPILFPAFVQMDVRYGMRPFKVGEDIVIKAAFSTNPNDLSVELEGNDYFKPRMNPVFINAFTGDDENDEDAEKTPIHEVNWKVEALKNGITEIAIKVNGQEYKKKLVIGNSRNALSNKKMNKSSWEHFIYPSEDLLPEDGSLEHIYIQYPGKNISFAGITTHWLVYNLLLVLIIVLALRKRFGVEF
jgi:hypothetical protein